MAGSRRPGLLRSRTLAALVTIGAAAATLFAGPASPGPALEAAPLGPTNVPWSVGTITFIANIHQTLNGTDEYGAPLSKTERYREAAVYRLTGKSAGGALRQATMTGSGTGTSIFKGGKQGTCALNNEPANQWAYKGPATVKMTYTAGKLFVYAQPVMTRLRTVFTGCPGSHVPPLVRVAAVPHNGLASFLVKVSPRAGTVSGSRSFPIRETSTNMNLTGTVGTATVRWVLHSAATSCVNPGTGKCP
jgi:hypothetical protein